MLRERLTNWERNYTPDEFCAANFELYLTEALLEVITRFSDFQTHMWALDLSNGTFCLNYKALKNYHDVIREAFCQLTPEEQQEHWFRDRTKLKSQDDILTKLPFYYQVYTELMDKVITTIPKPQRILGIFPGANYEPLREKLREIQAGLVGVKDELENKFSSSITIKSARNVGL